ncbi:enoyl-CoA hydratase/isomerase family protein [Allopusillimonas ginsengisoli]|uniref:enoyl-CoA hydratase/isomerase family protein n=1 Tax=Allopusillimonas ginsengisoli TaxID=453575 RepID=UPI0010218D50|nr:enoyl-CoA hydratase/isomerase family protein [Allopusillimonas ginsengisoli]TEA77076.1 enoyl-CoA hydratase/isomerase family protein [Allopusillimonas ginsengisoli]
MTVQSDSVAQDQCLIKNIDGGTLWLTMNRPDKRNALSDLMLIEMRQTLTEAFHDDAVRSIVILGAGGCFSAGRDLKDLGGPGAVPVYLHDDSLDKTVDIFTEVLCMLLESPKPTIAAVHGFAVGGGQAITLACDFVVAEESAKFANVEIQYGFPAALNTVLLTRHLGRRQALEIAMSGSLRSSSCYQELGLVNRVCATGTIKKATREFANELNSHAPWALRRTKAILQMAQDCPLEIAMQQGGQLNQLLRLGSTLEQAYGESEQSRQRVRSSVKSEIS